MSAHSRSFRVASIVTVIVGIFAFTDAWLAFAQPGDVKLEDAIKGRTDVTVVAEVAVAWSEENTFTAGVQRCATTQGDADLANELDLAEYAYARAKGPRDEALLAKHAQAEWDEAKKKGAEAEAKAKAGDIKAAIAAYKGAAKAFKDAIALAERKENAVKAAPIIKRLNAAKDKFVARALLAQLEGLIASDPRMPALRKKVKDMPMPKEATIELGRKKVPLKLVLVKAGKFMMGSPDTEKGRSSDEGPQHEVTISKPFYMGVYEVTQEQYEAFTRASPSHFKDPAKPVEQVNLNDAIGFCKRASETTGKKFRLPTEAEWEYACRAGSKTRFGFGDDDTALGDHAWYKGNSDSKTQKVGKKKPNAWGLYDMHGNVWEWCSDYYADYDAKAKNIDPQGPASGSSRLLRGGSWRYDPQLCRSAYRYINTPVLRSNDFGFRVVVDLK